MRLLAVVGTCRGRNPLCRELVNTPLYSVQSQNRTGVAHVSERSDVELASTAKPTRGETRGAPNNPNSPYRLQRRLRGSASRWAVLPLFVRCESDCVPAQTPALWGSRRLVAACPSSTVRSACVFTGGAATRGRRSGGSLRSHSARELGLGRQTRLLRGRSCSRPREGMSAGRIMSLRCRTPSDLSKDLGDCRVAARLWARWGLGMRRRVRSRRRGESRTSRTSGSGGRARASSPS
jgi:hypothetical protein